MAFLSIETLLADQVQEYSVTDLLLVAEASDLTEAQILALADLPALLKEDHRVQDPITLGAQ